MAGATAQPVIRIGLSVNRSSQQFGQHRQHVAEFSLTDSDKLYPTGIIVRPLLVIYNCTSTDRNNYAEDSQTSQQTDKPRNNIISLSQVQ